MTTLHPVHWTSTIHCRECFRTFGISECLNSNVSCKTCKTIYRDQHYTQVNHKCPYCKGIGTFLIAEGDMLNDIRSSRKVVDLDLEDRKSIFLDKIKATKWWVESEKNDSRHLDTLETILNTLVVYTDHAQLIPFFYDQKRELMSKLFEEYY